MTAVFSHGRLRLYLLKLLDDGPKHGYELIRLLEERFLGLYAPSAGTIYPRLQRLEVEGLVTHTAAGGRKVYEITDAGRAELRAARRRAGHPGIRHHRLGRGPVRPGRRDPDRGTRLGARPQARAARGGPADPAGPAGTGAAAAAPAARRARRPGESPLLAEFDQRLAEFTVEVGALVRAGRLSDASCAPRSGCCDGRAGRAAPSCCR